MSQAWAARQPEHQREGPWWAVHPFLAAAAAVVLASTVLALITPAAAQLPKELTITTAPVWDALVDWVTVNLYDPLNLFRDGLLIHVLIPLRDAFQWLPWLAVMALCAGAGWVLGGLRLTLLVSVRRLHRAVRILGTRAGHDLHGVLLGAGVHHHRPAGRHLGLATRVAHRLHAVRL